MNKTIKNTIVFTNGDSVVINEPISLPLKEKVMYKIKNSEKNAIIVTSNGETVIPINNILFAVVGIGGYGSRFASRHARTRLRSAHFYAKVWLY